MKGSDGLYKFCQGCRVHLHEREFHGWSFKRGRRQCAQCFNASKRKKNTDPTNVIRNRLYASEKKRTSGDKKVIKLTKRATLAIMKKYNNECVITKKDGDLTIVRYFIDLPISEHPWNTVLVDTSIARKLPRLDQAKRSARFDKNLQEYMTSRRDFDNIK